MDEKEHNKTEKFRQFKKNHGLEEYLLFEIDNRNRKWCGPH